MQSLTMLNRLELTIRRALHKQLHLMLQSNLAEYRILLPVSVKHREFYIENAKLSCQCIQN